jgi:PTS system nitrogen regulatory IIA component
MSHLAQYLWPEDILLDIEVADKGQLFDAIGRHMEKEHAIPKDCVVVGLVRRERVGSTGLGCGIAIPHARVEGLSRIQIAYLRLKKPIPYDACDGRPVSDVMALLVPKRATDEHLLILADATQMLADHRFLDRLHTCHRPAEVRSLFEFNPSINPERITL